MLTNSLTARAVEPTDPTSPPPRLFAGETLLITVGLIGLLLCLPLGVLWLVHGPLIGPEGNLLKPLEFNFALGLFVLNTAAILPLARLKPRSRSVYRWLFAVQALYAYYVETALTLRGFDPRFSHLWHSFAQALPSALFGLDSILIMLSYGWLTVRYFVVNKDRYQFVLAVRYGLLSVLLTGFGSGIWMLHHQGHHAGAAGNMVWLHFMGFVGLKLMSLTGWFAEQSPLTEAARRRWIHVAGWAWLLACALLAVHITQGLSIVTISPAWVGAVACMLVWGAVTLRLNRGLAGAMPA